jgi:hypothetical protein
MKACCPRYVVKDGEFDRCQYVVVPGTMPQKDSGKQTVTFSERVDIISFCEDDKPTEISVAARAKILNRRATGGPKLSDISHLPSAQ